MARHLRDLLIPALIAAAVGILALLAFVVAHRTLLDVLAWRQARWRARYVAVVRAATAGAGEGAESARRVLLDAPRRHRAVIADLLLEPLRVVQGTAVDRARAVALDLGLLDHWRRGLARGQWPSRARAALAVGLLRDNASVAALVRLLDSGHGEVQAAAIDALGLIGDVAAVQALLPRIGQQSRHHQARIVEALRGIGPPVTAFVVSLGITDAMERRLMAEVLALVGGTGARATLLEWTADADPTVRAAAWRAIGLTGMDDRIAYHALRAMTDADSRVRAHAAQAIGRTGRTDFAPYLAGHLDDEWEVAAQGARALSRLGDAGISALRAREASGAGGHGLELARHFLWERVRP